jgi:hypothetical protein
MHQYYAKQDFDNFGFLSATFTEDQLRPIKNEITKINDNFNNGVRANEHLVGQIAKEYLLIESKNYIEELIGPFTEEYNKIYNYNNSVRILTKDAPLVLSSAWVNFQKKHEYNPLHSHTGFYSFVIWIKVPYTIEEEIANFPAQDASVKLPGYFEFTYNNVLGQLKTYNIPVDKTYENKMIFFPAPMFHSVNPFYTSDDYRISISGNFLLDVS